MAVIVTTYGYGQAKDVQTGHAALARAVATHRASRIATGSCARLQAGLPPSRFSTVTPGQATTATHAAVKTAIRRD